MPVYAELTLMEQRVSKSVYSQRLPLLIRPTSLLLTQKARLLTQAHRMEQIPSPSPSSR
jgi:hypothetical protein